MDDLLNAIADSLKNEAYDLKSRDVRDPELGKTYQWNLRANILSDLSKVLRGVVGSVMVTMNKQYQELFREEFEKEMAAKTGWGRNEIMMAFDRASSRAAIRLLDEGKR